MRVISANTFECGNCGIKLFYLLLRAAPFFPKLLYYIIQICH
jgi:hypothetical protein